MKCGWLVIEDNPNEYHKTRAMSCNVMCVGSHLLKWGPLVTLAEQRTIFNKIFKSHFNICNRR